MIEIRHLYYLLAVAQEQNITRAAERLHLTQPTLSKQRMDLERQLGKQLFVLGKRKITLTDEGIFCLLYTSTKIRQHFRTTVLTAESIILILIELMYKIRNVDITFAFQRMGLTLIKE